MFYLHHFLILWDLLLQNALFNCNIISYKLSKGISAVIFDEIDTGSIVEM